MEIWTSVQDYENLYAVSNMGRVLSLPKEWIAGNNTKRKHEGKILVPSYTGKDRTGYQKVILYKNGTKKIVKIHQLVAKHFLPMPSDDKLIIDHINGNKEDNRACNLRWVNHFENSCCNPNTPTTDNKPIVQYALDGSILKEYYSIKEAARQTGLNQGNISHCLLGKYKTCGGTIWKFKT